MPHGDDGVFAMSPQRRSQSQTDPTREYTSASGVSRSRNSAASPAGTGELRYRGLHADTLRPSRDRLDLPLKRRIAFGAIARATTGPAVKVKPRKGRPAGSSPHSSTY